jgi:phosphoglucosamine mutase
MKRELFGTDGIRGVAGVYPLDAPTVYAVGVALGRWIDRQHGPSEVVIGMDTRESGPWIASHAAAGLAVSGVRARSAGLITTPGVAYLARTGPFAAGVMISASHNPYRDNGIKVLDHSGFKLPDAQEHAIEQDIFEAIEAGIAPAILELEPDESLDAEYVDYLASTFPARLDGMPIVVDAANGSASFIGPKLFERLGAQVTAIASAPNGQNINLDCGSLHLDHLREHVLRQGAAIGIAFDGDADRALFVSHSGAIVDGDAVMLLTGVAMKQSGRLQAADGRAEVVATVMSNLGLEKALARHGIEMLRTPVGDKYVLEEMERRGAKLGGEQSGHVIFRDYATTGDGLLTALRVLETICRSGKTLDDLTAGFFVYPQLLVNVRVKQRRPISELPRVTEAIRAAETEFDGSGRVLVRFSGTEPLARVMVEGPEHGQVERLANNIADVLRAELGCAT